MWQKTDAHIAKEVLVEAMQSEEQDCDMGGKAIHHQRDCMERSENEMRNSFDAAIDELSRLGSAVYETRLKAELEPKYDGQFVAIHVDTGDDVVARSSGDAMRAMHTLHPDSRLFVRKIGDEPEYGLAARILVSEMMAERQK